jgi:hypothetical protein
MHRTTGAADLNATTRAPAPAPAPSVRVYGTSIAYNGGRCLAGPETNTFTLTLVMVIIPSILFIAVPSIDLQRLTGSWWVLIVGIILSLGTVCTVVL